MPNLKPTLDSDNARKVNKLPDPDDFYYIMYNRICHFLKRFDFLKNNFLIFINTLERESTRVIIKNDIQDYIYAGISQMMEQAKRISRKAEPWQDAGAVNALKKRFEKARVYAKVDGKENQKTLSYLYQKERIELRDIAVKASASMGGYFRSEAELSDNQKLERELLLMSFDQQDLEENYFYLSLPLIVFGEYDGVVHIIHHRDDRPELGLDPDKSGITNEALYKMQVSKMIKWLSYETEAIWLDWEIIGEYLHRFSAIDEIIKEVTSERFKRWIEREADRVVILKELNYLEYYQEKLQEAYYRKRLEQSDHVTEEIYRKDLSNVIIKILLDSYAHNVSAHSLTALNWKLKYRTEKRREREKKLRLWHDLRAKKNKYQQQLSYSLSEFISLSEELLDPKDLTKGNTMNYLQEFPGSLSVELQPLIAYLMEKGTFWSGVSRDYNHGGVIMDLFSIIWKDFINNPLFLGTIAQSEGIFTIGVKVLILEPDPDFEFKQQHARWYQKKIAADRRGKKLAGELGRIHIGYSWNYTSQQDIEAAFLDVENDINEADKELIRNRSRFVSLGEEFWLLKPELEKKKLFIPGGVVGKQALLTMLENEIRNIKHYSHEKKDHLDLVLSVQPIPSKPHGENEFFQIGVWLDRQTYLDRNNTEPGSEVPVEAPNSDRLLIYQKHRRLYADLIDREKNTVQLGGTYQDKVCASFLVTGSFSEVQKPRSSNVEQPDADESNTSFYPYYPWLISATSTSDYTKEDMIEDFCLIGEVEGIRNPKRDDERAAANAAELTKKLYREYPHKLPQKGYLKKFFHCWIGENIKYLDVSETTDPGSFSRDDKGYLSTKNRYRFLCLQDGGKVMDGCIRILTDCPPINTLPEEEQIFAIYEKWLSKWLGTEKILLQVLEKETKADTPGQGKKLYFDGSKGELQIFEPAHKIEEPSQTLKLVIIHADHTDTSWDFINFRNHGVYKQYYSGGPRYRKAEFLETIFTQIAIFDNRCYQRVAELSNEIPERKRARYQEDLHLEFFKEEMQQWEKYKEKLSSIHFLIMHLTFIESIIKEKYPTYEDSSNSDSELGFFIEREIPEAVKERGKNGQFFLIITTGRGRIDWWEKLQNSIAGYKKFLPFSSFRPIEPILSVVEDAQSKKDDIDLKHNLVKVIFGS